MSKAAFDTFADSYLEVHRRNISASGDEPSYFARYKIADIAADRKRRGLSNEAPLTVIDFGSGIGVSVGPLKAFFGAARIIAADVSAQSLALNKAQNGDNVDCVHFDGVTLPIACGTADLVLAACVFHHIPRAEHTRSFTEIARILKPGGDVYAFEHNPWNPITRAAVDACPFDDDAELIAGPALAKTMRAAGLRTFGPVHRYFFPARLAALRPLERWLQAVPIGAQYFVRGSQPGRMN